MHDSLNLNSIPKITPKESSWNKVMMRLEAEKTSRKIIPFRLYSITSVAASLLFLISGIVFGITSNQNDLEFTFEALEESETISWYNSLGEGVSIEEFSTILDEYK